MGLVTKGIMVKQHFSCRTIFSNLLHPVLPNSNLKTFKICLTLKCCLTETELCSSVQPVDTVNILRGIKEKYESFHGVRIADRALVVAAELSHRYIQNRFLPDKAIDLMDEAASNLRVQLESKPEDIDIMQRALYRLQVEEHALTKEKDKVSFFNSCNYQFMWLSHSLCPFYHGLVWISWMHIVSMTDFWKLCCAASLLACLT